MDKRILYIFSTALLVGGLSGCSSSDDMPDNPNPVVNPNLIGEAMDDVTAEMQSTIYNCAQSGTRAQTGTRAKSDIDAINAQLPTLPEGFFNNAVPSNAVDVTGSNVNDYNIPNSPKTNTGGGTWVVPKDKEKSGLELNMQDATLYVEGTATLTNTWGDGKIIVKKGGHLIVDTKVHRLLAGGGTTIVEEGGKLTSASNSLVIASNEKVYIDGDLNIDYPCIQGTLYVYGDLTGKNFINPTDKDKGIMDSDTRLYVSGKLTSTDADLKTDGYIHVGNGIDTRPYDIYFKNSTKLLADCGIKAKNVKLDHDGVEVHANYINCDNLYQCAASKIFLEDKGFINVNDTYKNDNNGNDASIIMEGKNAMGVLKATTIIFNGSNSTDIFFAKTNPDEGKQCLGIDCNNYKYDEQGGNYKTLEFKDLNFKNGTVERIVDGKVVDNDGLATSDAVAYSIPKDPCQGDGYQPDHPVNPDTPKPVVVAESHTHDISATCVQTNGTNVYVSYHKRGNGRSGCLEVFNTTGNKTTLKQFVRDHNNAIDFNHIALDKTNKRLYAVGNNKSGGFLGFMNIKDGLLDCKSTSWNGIDSTDIDTTEGKHVKYYKALRLVKLYQAQQTAAGNGSKNGGDGNCVIVNGDKLDVASTYGYEVYDNLLNPVRITKKEGRAKHLAYAPDGKTFYAIHYDNTPIAPNDTMKEVGLVLEKFNTRDVNMQSPLFSKDANKVKPNNGKNAICVYGGKVYVCQSMNGLYVYDAKDGHEVGHYQENIKSSKTGEDLAICANGVAVDDKYVYIAYGTRGLVVLDHNLQKVTSFVAQRSANYVTLANGYIYVAYGRDCLKVFKLVE